MSKATTEDPKKPEAATSGDPFPVPVEGAEASGAENAASADPAAEWQAEALKWKDTALRSAAELDNYRKRIARETQDARAYANAELLRSLLPIMDTFELGLDAARAENEKSMIFLGLNMVRGQFQNFLREQGVEEINALCQTFDPNLHEAVGQESHADAPEGTVIRVLRKGFKLKDRLLRAAAVIVSTGSSATSAENGVEAAVAR